MLKKTSIKSHEKRQLTPCPCIPTLPNSKIPSPPAFNPFQTCEYSELLSPPSPPNNCLLEVILELLLEEEVLLPAKNLENPQLVEAVSEFKPSFGTGNVTFAMFQFDMIINKCQQVSIRRKTRGEKRAASDGTIVSVR